MATAPRDDRERLEDLAYVGPRTAEQLAAADVSADDVREKRVSYRDLVSAGVNPGVAAKLRREHSLHWTLDEQGADLDRRSEQVRGLRDGEREWIAAARSDGDRSTDDGNRASEDGDRGTDDGDRSSDGSTHDSAGDWPSWSDDGTTSERRSSAAPDASDDADEVPPRP